MQIIFDWILIGALTRFALIRVVVHDGDCGEGIASLQSCVRVDTLDGHKPLSGVIISVEQPKSAAFWSHDLVVKSASSQLSDGAPVIDGFQVLPM